MNTSVVLFKDEEKAMLILVCRFLIMELLFVFVMAVCLILTMLKFCTISTMFITSNRRSNLAAFTINCLTISKTFTLARNNFNPLRRVFVLCIVSYT